MPHTRGRTTRPSQGRGQVACILHVLVLSAGIMQVILSAQVSANSGRVTPNRRHFLDARGDTPGCQAVLGARNAPTENLIVRKNGECEERELSAQHQNSCDLSIGLSNFAIFFSYTYKGNEFLYNRKTCHQHGYLLDEIINMQNYKKQNTIIYKCVFLVVFFSL